MDFVTILTVIGLLCAIGASLAGLCRFIQQRSYNPTPPPTYGQQYYIQPTDASFQTYQTTNRPKSNNGMAMFVGFGLVVIVLAAFLFARLYQAHQMSTLPGDVQAALSTHINEDSQATVSLNQQSVPQYGQIGNWSVSYAFEAPYPNNVPDSIHFGPFSILWCAIINPPLQEADNVDFTTNPPTPTYLPVSHFWIYQTPSNPQWQVYEVESLDLGSDHTSAQAIAAFQSVGCSG